MKLSIKWSVATAIIVALCPFVSSCDSKDENEDSYIRIPMIDSDPYEFEWDGKTYINQFYIGVNDGKFHGPIWHTKDLGDLSPIASIYWCDEKESEDIRIPEILAGKPNSGYEVPDTHSEVLSAAKEGVTVAGICVDAFYGLENLRIIRLPSSIGFIYDQTFSSEYVRDFAFMNPTLAEIYSERSTPISFLNISRGGKILKSPGLGFDTEKVILHVPQGSLDAWRQDPVWGQVTHIVDDIPVANNTAESKNAIAKSQSDVTYTAWVSSNDAWSANGPMSYAISIDPNPHSSTTLRVDIGVVDVYGNHYNAGTSIAPGYSSTSYSGIWNVTGPMEGRYKYPPLTNATWTVRVAGLDGTIVTKKR